MVALLARRTIRYRFGMVASVLLFLAIGLCVFHTMSGCLASGDHSVLSALCIGAVLILAGLILLTNPPVSGRVQSDRLLGVATVFRDLLYRPPEASLPLTA